LGNTRNSKSYGLLTDIKKAVQHTGAH
jgi:hypothetical protein